MPTRLGRNIILIGMRCSGKTTLGRELARRTGRPFVDLDEALARRSGRSADEVLRQDGEAAFRRLEAQVLRWAAGLRGHVIATGGGAVLAERPFRALARTGIVVYLQAPAAELTRRGRRRPRAALTDGSPEREVETLFAARDPLYRAAAEFTIPVVGTDPILDLLAVAGAPERT